MRGIVLSSVPVWPLPTTPGTSAVYTVVIEGEDMPMLTLTGVATSGLIWEGPNIPAKPGTTFAVSLSGKRFDCHIHQFPETTVCPSA